MPVAIVTGASKGFGLALTRELVSRGWEVVVDARDASALRAAGFGSSVTVIPGDVTDPDHRASLVGAVSRLDLLVNNASALGPMPPLAEYPLNSLAAVYEANVVAPLALIQLALPLLTKVDGTIVNVSSDAAVEAYEGWGGYGSSKAALDRLSAVLGVENPSIRVYAFDPGDMRTDMHQAAFPDEDISDRPPPESVVPSLLKLLDSRPDSGRYTK